MLFDGVEILEGASVINLTLPKGTAFPGSPDVSELFYRTDLNKAFIYSNGGWNELGAGSTGTASMAVDIVTSITAVTSPTTGNAVFALDVGKFYIYDGSTFNIIGNATVTASYDGVPGNVGDFIYNVVDAVLYVFDGTNYVPCSKQVAVAANLDLNSVGKNGDAVFNQSNSTLYIYENGHWTKSTPDVSIPKPVSVVATLDTNVAGTEGELKFNSADNKTYVYANGGWNEVIPSSSYQNNTPQIYDIAVSNPGDVTTSSTILFFVSPRSFTISPTFVGSVAAIGTNNGDCTFTIYNNGQSAATVSFANNSLTGTFTVVNTPKLSFSAGDVLSIDSPSSNAPSNLAITLKAVV